jgi:hypothetical protein
MGGGACAALVPLSRINHHCCIRIIISRIDKFCFVPDEKKATRAAQAPLTESRYLSRFMILIDATRAAQAPTPPIIHRSRPYNDVGNSMIGGGKISE